jgi:TrmH family RNA methyltransferase
MARRICITSNSNPRLKQVRRLRRCSRNGAAAFVVEGYRQVSSALEADAVVRELYVCAELYLGESEAGLAAAAERAGAAVFELSSAAFESISSEVRADGVAAVVDRWPTGLDELRVSSPPLLLVAESVERPGNLGTIVRTACSAGADGLVVCDGRTGVFHPETVRGSLGTLFNLPVAESSTEAAISWLRRLGIRVVVATPTAARAHWDADLTGPLAVVVGNERYGVTERWLDAAAETVRIPMPGPADSVNVAVAAGIVLFEAVRQRALAAEQRYGVHQIAGP